MHINISLPRNLLVINWLPYKGVRAPHAEGRLPWGGAHVQGALCRKRRRKAAGL